MNDKKSAITALVFSLLMLITPMASAANVTTFSSGESEILVEVRDSPEYTNIEDGTVTLPAGDTVTSASVKLSTGMATHNDHSTINGDTAQYVWDPAYNVGQTEYSTLSDFTYQEEIVKLVSGGFSTDFERTDAGFFDHTQPPIFDGTTWQHGSLSEGTTLNDNCNTGNGNCFKT